MTFIRDEVQQLQKLKTKTEEHEILFFDRNLTFEQKSWLGPLVSRLFPLCISAPIGPCEKLVLHTSAAATGGENLISASPVSSWTTACALTPQLQGVCECGRRRWIFCRWQIIFIQASGEHFKGNKRSSNLLFSSFRKICLVRQCYQLIRGENENKSQASYYFLFPIRPLCKLLWIIREGGGKKTRVLMKPTN